MSSWLALGQPPVSRARLDAAAKDLTRYRIMAFVTGVILITGCVLLIIQAVGPSLEPATGFVWVAHGWLFLVYVIATAVLGFKLRWPLPRYALVMAAGTIPTMSFVAEHFVTRAARAAAAGDPRQPVPLAD
jgi:integral membrane protein